MEAKWFKNCSYENITTAKLVYVTLIVMRSGHSSFHVQCFSLADMKRPRKSTKFYKSNGFKIFCDFDSQA